ncbi:MAG: dihydroorotate dehydrogenase electron transfer subunit [Candidatus Nezhaarchaeales archaeon]
MARYYFKGIITSKKKESENVFSHTIFFEDNKILRKMKPGRFVMIWLPGCDEFPLSPSFYDITSSTMRLTFKIVGLGTKALASMNPGQAIFVRGPYGNGFAIPPITGLSREKPLLIVGGGVGIAPLLPLIHVITKNSLDLHVVCGFRSILDTFFVDEIYRFVGENLTITTDDGSMGIKGTAVNAVRELLKRKHFSYAFACGPEPMLFKLHKMLSYKGIPHQMLLERYVKCALGVCGSCVIDGFRLCKEGPVFDNMVLKRLSEFGCFKRLPSGIKEPIVDS